MDFKEKYSTKTEQGKITITSEAYAIGEMLEKLSNILRKLTSAMIK